MLIMLFYIFHFFQKSICFVYTSLSWRHLIYQNISTKMVIMTFLWAKIFPILSKLKIQSHYLSSKSYSECIHLMFLTRKPQLKFGIANADQGHVKWVHVSMLFLFFGTQAYKHNDCADNCTQFMPDIVLDCADMVDTSK